MRSIYLKPIVVVTLFATFLSATARGQEEQTGRKKIRKVKRVARPVFDKPKDDVYFGNVFKDGLVGDRPVTTPEIAAKEDQPSGKKKTENSTAGWSQLIGGSAIEDEVKALNQQLARSVTTPVKFKTTFNDVRQSMSLLSLSFAIIREYQGDVRWKDHAAAAHASLEQASIKARDDSVQAFNYCKARKLDLEDLIRGGSFPATEKPGQSVDWAKVIGRTETMIRLAEADQRLKEWTADRKMFVKQKSRIISEAQWVAAIATVIAKEQREDADDEEYMEFCDAMKKAAIETVSATSNDDFDVATKSANRISQSCNACHEVFR